MPIDVKPRVLSSAIDLDDPSASLELTLSIADYFELAELEHDDLTAALDLLSRTGEPVSLFLR